MPVSATENTDDSYVADGVEDTFEIRFKWYASAEVEVYLDDVLQGSGYSIVIDPLTDPDGSNDAVVVAHAVFDSPPADTVVVLLKQNLALTQEVDYLEFGKFPAASHEKALDKLTILVRELTSLVVSNNHYLGFFVDVADLPDPAILGDYADVYQGAYTDSIRYIWNGSIWVAGADGTHSHNLSDLTNDTNFVDDAGVSANADVTANTAKRTFSTANETKLDNIADGAEVNRQTFRDVASSVAFSHAHYTEATPLIDGVETVFYLDNANVIPSSLIVVYRNATVASYGSVTNSVTSEVTLSFTPKVSNGNELLFIYETL